MGGYRDNRGVMGVYREELFEEVFVSIQII